MCEKAKLTYFCCWNCTEEICDGAVGAWLCYRERRLQDRLGLRVNEDVWPFRLHCCSHTVPNRTSFLTP